MTPSQQRAYNLALATIPGAAITIIKGDIGMGKSLVVSHLQSQLGGAVYSLDNVMTEVVKRGAGKVEETLVDFVTRAFQHDDLVFIEDITMFDQLGASRVVDRPRYLHHVMAAVYEKIMATGARLVVATADNLNGNNATKAGGDRDGRPFGRGLSDGHSEPCRRGRCPGSTPTRCLARSRS